MAKKTMYFTSDQQAKIDELHRLLAARGIDLKDPNRGTQSDSAMFRWLVEQKLNEVRKSK